MTDRAPRLRIEDFLKENTFERRAHLIDDKGTYKIRSSLSHVRFGAVLRGLLPDYREDGTVMWIDAVQHTQVDESPEGKPTIHSETIGETSIAIGPRDFVGMEEIQMDGAINDYVRGWFKRYWPDGQSASAVGRTRPITDELVLLRNLMSKKPK